MTPNEYAKTFVTQYAILLKDTTESQETAIALAFQAGYNAGCIESQRIVHEVFKAAI